MDDQTYVDILSLEGGLKIFYDIYGDDVFRRIKNVDVLLQFRASNDYARRKMPMYVDYLLEIAKVNPAIITKIKSKANRIIQSAHTDSSEASKSVHADLTQSVRGISSDCHSDSILWKSAMTGFGHGFHKDGYYEEMARHFDTNLLSEEEREQLRNL